MEEAVVENERYDPNPFNAGWKKPFLALDPHHWTSETLLENKPKSSVSLPASGWR